MGENGPETMKSQACNACGHCVAACPYQAIDNIRAPLANQTMLPEFPVINSETARQYLRSRRSIRCYKNRAVTREQLMNLLDIARFAPTASNSQGISYIVVKDKEILKKATKVVIEWMEVQIKTSTSTHWSFPYHICNYKENGIDGILHDAPNLILATAAKKFKNGRENTISSLTYLELFATSLGLGSCWAGLFEMCAFSNYSPLLKLFDIPEDKEFTGAVMIGYPQYSYKSLVDRNPLEITWLE